jgi:glycosyltransferase involved in cell wall biosynthesis
LTHLRVPRDVVRVVPNAIEIADCDRPDASAQAAALRSSLGLGPADTIFLSVGRLEANKGFGTALRALSLLVREGALDGQSAWRWIFVGDGPMHSQLARDVAALHLERHVVFVGQANAANLHGWYEASTLFVHPSLYEGSSLVTLEAMAHRRAIVATTAGGLPDKVRTSVNGWLVPPGDIEALAGALREAVSNPQTLIPMGIASRSIVEQEFSWAVVGRQFLDLCGELTAQQF